MEKSLKKNALEPDYRRYSILFVDDEEITRHYFTRICKSDFEVLTAQDVNQALDILEMDHENIAVLLTDQRMPGLRGGQLLVTARKLYPDIVRMLTTAYMDIDEAIESVNQGEIFRYLDKPWDIDKLRASLFDAMHLFLARKKERNLLDHRREGLFLMAGKIADEIRTPLRKIVAANSFLKRCENIEVLTGRVKTLPVQQSKIEKALNEVETESKKAMIFMEMLQLSFHDNQQEPDPGQIHSMLECINESLSRYPFWAGERSKFHLDQQNDFVFKGPQIMMVHVFFSLIRHALESIDNHNGDSGVVEIIIEPDAEMNRVVMRDNGRGIPADQLPNIFNEIVSDNFGGNTSTEAGLAYCRKTLVFLSGRIDCVSEEGESTQFTLSLPLCGDKEP